MIIDFPVINDSVQNLTPKNLIGVIRYVSAL